MERINGRLYPKQGRYKILTFLGWLVFSALSIFFLLLILFILWSTAIYPNDQRIIPDHHKTEIRQLLKKHGLTGISVVEIRQDGSYWFERNGELCRLK